MSTTTSKKFELVGSKPHYAPRKQFAIKHLKLEVKPDFEEKSIECRETLDIIPIEDNLHHVVLDAAGGGRHAGRVWLGARRTSV